MRKPAGQQERLGVEQDWAEVKRRRRKDSDEEAECAEEKEIAHDAGGVDAVVGDWYRKCGQGSPPESTSAGDAKHRLTGIISLVTLVK